MRNPPSPTPTSYLFDPNVPRPGFLPITEYGVIGNLETVALVSPLGSVDWMCLPRFSSPSVLGRVLDPSKGGMLEVVPVRSGRASIEYITGTNVLRTRFELSKRRTLTIVDFMPITIDQPSSPSMLIRLVSARGGPIPIRTRLDARPGYGSVQLTWETTASGAIARADLAHWTYMHPSPLTLTDGGMVGGGTVRPGEPWAIELIRGDRPAGLPSSRVLLEQSIQFWQTWVRRGAAPLGRLPRAWRRWVLRSELALKLLSQRQSGAFVAAATTSIPEWPTGGRNWDYRYAWFRDAAFSAQALLLLGHVEEAEGFLRWVIGRLGVPGSPEGLLRPLYDAHGERIVPERSLPGWSGYMDARPVRVGNRAETQFQLDIYGEILSAALLYAHLHEEHVATYWPMLRGLAESVERRWTEPDHGIWEARGPPQHYVHSKVMAWVALDRASELAERFEGRAVAERFARTANEIRSVVERRGWDERRRSFMQAFDSDQPDASNLRIPLVRFLPFDDPRIDGTVRYIDRTLTHGPFVMRFLTDRDPMGPEGSFLACSFWRVECLARMGRLESAISDWNELLSVAGPLRLFSEEYDPVRRLPLGNYPQALTHIGVLRSAFALASNLGSEQAHPTVPHLLEYVRPPPNVLTRAAGEWGTSARKS
ncbi:MAG: glycoside hydrolase family 15 protein [Candidatus Thermoplasmatota archaeon]|nr:glycoside hydrolase family 15 protein [Candidatus Thermoplasmatota archaeon]